MPFEIPSAAGWILFLGVMILLYLQQPLYMVLVVMGVALLMILNGRTAVEQFGLARLPVSSDSDGACWSAARLFFIEMPLSTVVEKIMNAIHLHSPGTAIGGNVQAD